MVSSCCRWFGNGRPDPTAVQGRFSGPDQDWFEVMSDQAVCQWSGVAVVVDQFGVEVTFLSVLNVVEDLAEVDEFGVVFGGHFSDDPVDAEL